MAGVLSTDTQKPEARVRVTTGFRVPLEAHQKIELAGHRAQGPDGQLCPAQLYSSGAGVVCLS